MATYNDFKPVLISYASFDDVPIEERAKLKEYHLKALKEKRNKILSETDKYMMSDFKITTEKLEIVKQYRQALRDFTNNNYIMPDKPDFVITMN
jgi:predicted ATP-dependent Lon-type protease